MKKKISAAISLVLVFLMVITPTTAFANPVEEDESIDLFSMLVLKELTIALDLDIVTLTPGARELALEDFDYLVAKIMEVSPVQNIAARRLGVSLTDFFGTIRQLICDRAPMPALIPIFDERWANVSGDLEIAAVYMFTILFMIEIELDSLGHMGPQIPALVEMFFFITAYFVQREFDLEQLFKDLEITDPDLISSVERLFDADRRLHQLHYEIYNTPSVLWFYGIDPTQFDFDDIDIGGMIGTMDANNIVTDIIEPGRIAYLRINSFMNNPEFDSEVLFQFYRQIQDYEHLIIDLRGNGGGLSNYFPMYVLSMLVNDYVYFAFLEFFIASGLTEEFFVNPMSLAGADYLYGIFSIEEFFAEYVEDDELLFFNRDDLALLDYVIVWVAAYYPSEESIPFGGKIWLLVDGESASASESAAKISMGSGFATVVGEPTAGVTGVIYTFAALPNTGILFRIDLGYTVDQYGRSFEEFGVIPQIANMPGMDALQTVLALINAPQEAPFDDVDADAWYSAYVATVNNLGLMTGTGVGQFSPGGTVTYAQAITTLWRDAGELGATAGGTWYSDAVAWAEANGLPLTFSPADPISRQNIAIMFEWYAEYAGISLAPVRGYGGFSDTDNPSVRALYQAGIINGVGDGRFAPDGDATRAQFAALLTRLLAE